MTTFNEALKTLHRSQSPDPEMKKPAGKAGDSKTTKETTREQCSTVDQNLNNSAPDSEKESLRTWSKAQCRDDQTDHGNVNHLFYRTEGDLRYVPERGMWIFWNGQKWIADQYATHATAAAVEVAEEFFSLAEKVAALACDPKCDEGMRRNLLKESRALEAWAKRCRSRTVINNMIELAKKDARFVLPANQLDTDPWLLGVENGVVDLREGYLRRFNRREDYVTKQCPVAFNPDAQAPRWRQFIEEITSTAKGGPRPDLAYYMQSALGYAITGSTAEHKMFICIGAGANGKNVLLDMVQWILGDYCQTIQPEALMASRHDADAERATPSARKLAGARAAISSESKDGQRLDVALVKRHTGGGYMTARGLHENAYTFEITHKLWLMTNHRPALDHLDDALRGRLHLIPFDMQWNRPGHPDRNPDLPDGDKNLPTTLRTEAEGILAWLVEGAMSYADDGLDPPDEVVQLTRNYFNGQDYLAQWLTTCETCNAKFGTPARELHNAYYRWATDEGLLVHQILSQKKFSEDLVTRGIEKAITNKASLYGLKHQAGESFQGVQDDLV